MTCAAAGIDQPVLRGGRPTRPSDSCRRMAHAVLVARQAAASARVASAASLARASSGWHEVGVRLPTTSSGRHPRIVVQAGLTATEGRRRRSTTASRSCELFQVRSRSRVRSSTWRSSDAARSAKLSLGVASLDRDARAFGDLAHERELVGRPVPRVAMIEVEQRRRNHRCSVIGMLMTDRALIAFSAPRRRRGSRIGLRVVERRPSRRA